MADTLKNVYEILLMSYSLLTLAFILDLCMGDPVWLPHPVRAMGWMIGKAETFFRHALQISGQKSYTAERFAGILIVSIMLCSIFGLFYFINLIFHPVRYSLFTSFALFLLMVYLISTTLATKGLIDSADDVIAALVVKNITDARTKVGYIVGRDTDSLNEKGILRATIESLAENASDGIVAPLFYFAIGGLPLAMTYKAINTMDSMLGHRNKKYRYFGWAAARLDDIANYVPARITGILIVFSSFIISALHKLKGNSSRPDGFNLNSRDSFKVMLRDGGNHLSPNSGVPEAAMAGALGIRLGGPSYYHGEIVKKPYIGKERQHAESRLQNSGSFYLNASETAILITKLTSLLGFICAVSFLYVRSVA